MRSNNGVLKPNSHANLCHLSQPQLVLGYNNLKDKCTKKLRKQLETLTRNIQNDQLLVDIDTEGDMAEAFSLAVSEANTKGGNEKIVAALKQILNDESKRQGYDEVLEDSKVSNFVERLVEK